MRGKNLILLSFICLTIISCHPPRYIYSPAPPNNPYFREKGESKLSAYYSTSGPENDLENEYGNGFDLQAGYALSNHWAGNMQVTSQKLQWMHLDGGITLCPEAANGNANLEARNFTAFIGISLDLSKLKRIK